MMTQPSFQIAEAQALFEPDGVYLNTATMGLPPRPAWDALQASLDGWRRGVGDMYLWDEAVTQARESFADLVGVAAANVAVANQVSVFAGLVAAALPDDATVLVAEGDFTSLLFPFLAQRDRGVQVRVVELSRIVECVGSDVDLVAASAVQSADGTVLDLDALAAAATASGTQTFVDATQACGWLPLDASRFDYVAVSGYKWLLAPRGTAWLAVRAERMDELRPHHAGWYAGEDVHASYYGTPLRLASSARRFDVSPAWFSWVGAAPALRLLTQLGVPAIQAHNVALANRFRKGVGLPPANSAIVSTTTQAGAAERLAAAGVVAGIRAGRLRCSFHLYNTEADVDRALEALSLPSRR
ncbi:MAG: aminotransferase class V-fold PLP-dependent enzyme [Actinomycetota bacterium]|jgi:selenocysteine lyase/cysteine desulfurase|nr:aminotransferase class V-fold PLP-dependent enzyme [Actinomycetota bacterium]